MSLEHTTHQIPTHSTELAHPTTVMRGSDLHSITTQGLGGSDRGEPGVLAASAYRAGSDANGARGSLDHSTNRVLADIDRAMGSQGGPLSSSELVASAHRLPEVREPSAAPSIRPSETSGPFERQTPRAGSDANGARGSLDHSTNRVLADIDRAMGSQGGPLSSSELVASAHRLPEVREPSAASSIRPSETSGPFERQTPGQPTTDQARTRQAPPENAGQNWRSQVREASRNSSNDGGQSQEAARRAEQAQRDSEARAARFQQERATREAQARQDAENRRNRAETERLLREALSRQDAEKRQRNK